MAEFLVKLRHMNWVEQRYRREQAIADGGIKIWEDICTELKGCVESYNSRYGSKPVHPVICDAANGVIKIRKTIKPGNPSHAASAIDATIDVSLCFGAEPRITSIQVTPQAGLAGTVTKPVTIPHTFLLDADADGVFLTYEGQRIEMGDASRVILKTFLFGG
jgi:hypothetical protein